MSESERERESERGGEREGERERTLSLSAGALNCNVYYNLSDRCDPTHSHCADRTLKCIHTTPERH